MSFGTPTATGGAAPLTITCSKETGSTFSIGTTTVTCTVLDARQRTDGCTFNVVVLPTPKIQFTKFVAFGDSVTFGENGVSSLVAERAGNVLQPMVQYPFSQTYPGALQGLLAARYTTQSVVVTNQGLRGERAGAPGTTSRFSSVVAGGQYQVVLLMEGSNDLSDRDSRLEAAAITNLGRMVRDAKSRGVRPYLATVPPMISNTARGLAWSLVPGFNDQIRSLAAAEGITLVDVYGALNTAPTQYIGFDGLHPNETGYAKIAETFFTALKATLDNTPATSTSFGLSPLTSPPVVRRRGR